MEEINLEQAEILSKKTSYAIEAVGEPINWGDAAAFFLEGFNLAVSKQQPQVVMDANIKDYIKINETSEFYQKRMLVFAKWLWNKFKQREYSCPNCQGNGCTTCNGFGTLISTLCEHQQPQQIDWDLYNNMKEYCHLTINNPKPIEKNKGLTEYHFKRINELAKLIKSNESK